MYTLKVLNLKNKIFIAFERFRMWQILKKITDKILVKSFV